MQVGKKHTATRQNKTKIEREEKERKKVTRKALGLSCYILYIYHCATRQTCVCCVCDFSLQLHALIATSHEPREKKNGKGDEQQQNGEKKLYNFKCVPSCLDLNVFFFSFVLNLILGICSFSVIFLSFSFVHTFRRCSTFFSFFFCFALAHIFHFLCCAMILTYSHSRSCLRQKSDLSK